MGDTELISYRVQQNEKDNIQLKSDILEIKQTLSRMEQRLAIIPEKGFDCPLHLLRMNQYEKRLETMETKMESVHTKIISWTAVASVILFIVSSFAVPYIQKHFQEAPHQHVEPVKTSQWLGYPMPSPMPFSYSSNIVDIVKK
jgi:hypothetical protein